MAELERSVYGSRRMISEMMMMAAVPESRSGSSLNAKSSVMPRTEPGMMYGNIESVSMISVSQLFLRVVR